MVREELTEVLPTGMHHRIDEKVMQTINELIDDDGMRDTIRENLISYTSVLTEGRYKIDSYLTAVKYASYKLCSETNQLAFSRTFPLKMAQWKAEGRHQKEIARYTTAYNQSKLVTAIMKQARMPTSILNADVFQEAIMTNAEIMRDTDISPMVRMQAANSIMTHIKPPEVTKIELEVGVKSNDIMNDLRVVSEQFARAQQLEVLSGRQSIKNIAEARIINEEQ